MRAMIIDDERLARDELKRLLLAHPTLQIVGEAANIIDAAKAIEQWSPDLIFLDIQMPGGSGFDLLAALDDPPEVIFTTAFDQYAIRAFQVSALDYLLKPIDPLRLAQAIQKMQRRTIPTQIAQTTAQPTAQTTAQPTPQTTPQTRPESDAPQAPDGKVFIKDGDRCWFVALDQIMLFESEGNYTRVYFEQNRPLLLRSLNQLEARLEASKFIRVSRRQIVNMAFVESMVNQPTGGITLTLQGDIKVNMSRRRAIEFRQTNRL